MGGAGSGREEPIISSANCNEACDRGARESGKQQATPADTAARSGISDAALHMWCLRG